MAEIYMMRITEAGRVVAEAKLEILDKEAAKRNFYETLPGLIPNGIGWLVQMMQLATGEADLPADFVGLQIAGNHSGIQLANEMPKNGHAGPGPLRGH